MLLSNIYERDKVWKKGSWLANIYGEEILITLVAQAVPTFSMSRFKLHKGLHKVCLPIAGGRLRRSNHDSLCGDFSPWDFGSTDMS
jgi:hypothetical protein